MQEKAVKDVEALIPVIRPVQALLQAPSGRPEHVVEADAASGQIPQPLTTHRVGAQRRELEIQRRVGGSDLDQLTALPEATKPCARQWATAGLQRPLESDDQRDHRSWRLQPPMAARHFLPNPEIVPSHERS